MADRVGQRLLKDTKDRRRQVGIKLPAPTFEIQVHLEPGAPGNLLGLPLDGRGQAQPVQQAGPQPRGDVAHGIHHLVDQGHHRLGLLSQHLVPFG